MISPMESPKKSPMKGPFLIALAAGLLSLLLAFVPVLWHMVAPGPAPAPALHGAPWQVDTPAPGRSRVFGLALPGSTLGSARQRWGEDLKVAVIAGPDGSLALEAYLEQFSAGGVAGRLVLAFGADAANLAAWRNAVPGTPTGSGDRWHVLGGASAAVADAAPLVGLSFIPAAQLDGDTLIARLGVPAERLPGGERLTHWLYPALGLAVALDAQGKEVLQYVAPAEFERRLAAPLRRP